MATIARCRRPGRPRDRHARARIVAVVVIASVLLAGCDSQERILTDEPFRMAVPDNAELIDEAVDDGSSLIKDGERSVLRSFAPRPPAEPADVLDALVAEGEATGWEVVERSPARAVALKEVEGRQWTASVSVEGERVRQLLAGR
jgi:type IV pilus biogenesis protein CpaD/CtpE